jgi:hypothetical protein
VFDVPFKKIFRFESAISTADAGMKTSLSIDGEHTQYIAAHMTPNNAESMPIEDRAYNHALKMGEELASLSRFSSKESSLARTRKHRDVWMSKE